MQASTDVGHGPALKRALRQVGGEQFGGIYRQRVGDDFYVVEARAASAGLDAGDHVHGNVDGIG